MQTSQNSMAGQVYAGFFVRLAAYLIDITIVWLVLFIVRLPIWATTLVSSNNFLVRDLIFEYSIKDMLLYVLSAAYFILLTYFTGSTLGKKLFNIKVVSAENRKFTLFEIVFRETVGRFLSKLIIFVGYFMIGIDGKKRGLHDILSDTCVVYKYPVYENVNSGNINGNANLDETGVPNEYKNSNINWNMTGTTNTDRKINSNLDMSGNADADRKINSNFDMSRTEDTTRGINSNLDMSRTEDEARGINLNTGMSRTGDEARGINLNTDMSRTEDEARGINSNLDMSRTEDEARGINSNADMSKTTGTDGNITTD